MRFSVVPIKGAQPFLITRSMEVHDGQREEASKVSGKGKWGAKGSGLVGLLLLAAPLGKRGGTDALGDGGVER